MEVTRAERNDMFLKKATNLLLEMGLSEVLSYPLMMTSAEVTLRVETPQSKRVGEGRLIASSVKQMRVMH